MRPYTARAHKEVVCALRYRHTVLPFARKRGRMRFCTILLYRTTYNNNNVYTITFIIFIIIRFVYKIIIVRYAIVILQYWRDTTVMVIGGLYIYIYSYCTVTLTRYTLVGYDNCIIPPLLFDKSASCNSSGKINF